MSGSTYNARSNEITYAGYCALGGAANPRLLRMLKPNGTFSYFLM